MIVPIFTCCFLVIGYFPDGLGAYNANKVMGYWNEGRTGYYVMQNGFSRTTAAQVFAARDQYRREHNLPLDWDGTIKSE